MSEVDNKLSTNVQSKIDKEIQELTEWLNSNNYLNAKTDTFNIIRFLRAAKYNQEKARTKIKNFYKLRGTSTEWYDNRDPQISEMQALLHIGVFLPFLKRDELGRMVILIRIAAHDPYIHKQDDVFKIGLMTLDLALDGAFDILENGVIAIFDMEGVSYGHAKQLTTSMIRKLVHSWQDCYPVLVKGLHFINSPTYINVVLNIFRRFMREKMRKRVHVHGFDKASLHKIISKNILPEEYGGNDGKLQDLIDFWTQEVSQNQAWFIEDAKYKYIPVS